MPGYYFEFLQYLIRHSESVTGIQEVSQGRKPAGITAAEALETLQEAAQTRIRLKERNLRTSLSRLGKLIISRMLQFYREPRIAQITGKEGWPEFFEFFLQDTNKGMVAQRKKFETTKVNGELISQPSPDGIQTSAPSKGLFDIKVLSGTALPFQKAQRANLAFKLFEGGVIDEEELLDSIEWPNKEEVLRRVQEKKAAMAEQEQQQQGVQ